MTRQPGFPFSFRVLPTQGGAFTLTGERKDIMQLNIQTSNDHVGRSSTSATAIFALTHAVGH
jgi:hypothetical protein